MKFVCDWCVVNLFGGTELAIAVFCDCLVLGLWMQGLNSVVKLLGGRVQSGWCRQVVGGTVFAVAVICDCLALGSVCGALIRSSSCLAAGYNRMVLSSLQQVTAR